MSPTSQASVHEWSTLESDHPMPLIERRRVMGDNVMISHVTLEEGFQVAPHQHKNEQIACVLSGRIRFTLPDEPREVTLIAGQAILLPPNVSHGAEALERTIILDVFSPPSETTGVDDAHS